MQKCWNKKYIKYFQKLQQQFLLGKNTFKIANKAPIIWTTFATKYFQKCPIWHNLCYAKIEHSVWMLQVT